MLLASKKKLELKGEKTKAEIHTEILVEEDDEKRKERNDAVMSGRVELDRMKKNKVAETKTVENAFGEEAAANYTGVAPPDVRSEIETDFVDPPVQFHKTDAKVGKIMLYRLTKDGDFKCIKTTSAVPYVAPAANCAPTDQELADLEDSIVNENSISTEVAGGQDDGEKASGSGALKKKDSQECRAMYKSKGN